MIFVYWSGVVGLASFFLFAVCIIFDWDVGEKFFGAVSLLGLGLFMVIMSILFVRYLTVA